MTFIKLYNFKPEIGEYVNFIFTEHKNDYLCCKLTDYDLNCIMTFQCLTNKKKIKSLRSLAPLNKEMIGMIENISDDNIELNLININKKSDNYNIFLENNQKNHILKKNINQYVHKYNKDINFILNNFIYTLKSELNYLDQILELDNDFYNFVKLNLKKAQVKSNKIKLNIKCYGNINNLINLFDTTIEESSYTDINVTQSKLSEYTISSNSNLDNFIILLKNNILKYNDLVLI
jgi:hypothetical protein